MATLRKGNGSMNEVKSILNARRIRSITLGLLDQALRVSSVRNAPEGARDVVELTVFRTERELAGEIRHLSDEIRDQNPAKGPLLDDLETLVQNVLVAKDFAAVEAGLHEAQDFISHKLLLGEPIGHSGEFKTELTDQGLILQWARSGYTGSVQKIVESEIENLKFLAAVMEMCAVYRKRNSDAFATADILALEHAYRLLEGGVRLPRCYEPLWRTEERKHLTYLSFADPGDGHLKVTVRKSELLEGTIVHIEWIDRDNVDQKDLVEAYRLSSPIRAARVRLHVGAETPCTAFIGRPVFETKEPGKAIDEKQFEMALLKAAHTTAGACSAMFAQGVVDCKIAMDGMSAMQAITFMRTVAGNVVRDPETQWLSAAFNINTPIFDDRSNALGRHEVKEPLAIAELGVVLAKKGKFNKVTWDGASDVQQSKPLIGQLTRPQMLGLVHRAHEQNLETYISAGMVPEHMRDSVYIGIGGVGIGTSLHHKIGNVIAEINPSLVLDALKIRNDAEAHDAGRAAHKLAMLDWRWAEGTLVGDLNGLREDLFAVLLKFNQAFEVAASRLADLTYREKESQTDPGKKLTSEEVNEVQQLRKNISVCGKDVPDLRQILDRIAQVEEPTKPMAKASVASGCGIFPTRIGRRCMDLFNSPSNPAAQS
jgi:hypothetical protein